MESVKVVRCAWCTEPNEIFIDLSAGMDQRYTEDCQVCCRPNVYSIHIDPESLRIEVEVETEG